MSADMGLRRYTTAVQLGLSIAASTFGGVPSEVRDRAEPTSFVLPFWAGPLARTRYPKAVIREHGLCDGDIVEVAVSRMPVEKDEALIPEKVLELDKSGRVIRRWRMPIDTVVKGIKGDQILVLRPYVDREELLYIGTDGTFRVGPMIKSLPSPTQGRCDGLEDFKNSAYVGCFEFRDLKDGESRRLAYEGPCT